MLKLFWSPVSPYARKVMIVAHEVGVIDRLECVRARVTPLELNQELFRWSPLVKVPTLLLEDGTSLFDSRVICEYLDTLHPAKRLFPERPEERIAALRKQALGDGMTDLAVFLRFDQMRPLAEQSSSLARNTKIKLDAALDQLEAEADLLDKSELHIGIIAIGCALGYLEYRLTDDNWFADRPHLSAWWSRFNMRDSVRLTEPRAD